MTGRATTDVIVTLVDYRDRTIVTTRYPGARTAAMTAGTVHNMDGYACTPTARRTTTTRRSGPDHDRAARFATWYAHRGPGYRAELLPKVKHA